MPDNDGDDDVSASAARYNEGGVRYDECSNVICPPIDCPVRPVIPPGECCPICPSTAPAETVRPRPTTAPPSRRTTTYRTTPEVEEDVSDVMSDKNGL